MKLFNSHNENIITLINKAEKVQVSTLNHLKSRVCNAVDEGIVDGGELGENHRNHSNGWGQQILASVLTC